MRVRAQLTRLIEDKQMTFRIFGAAFAIAMALAAPAFAHSIELGSLSLTDLWTRATPPGAPTAGGYLTITNSGSEPDRLIAVSSPVSGKSELHIMETKDGVMTMHPVDGIEIPAGGSVALAPGGFHLMFITLSEPLKEGAKMPVTLTFEKAGSIDTFLHILAIGSDGPDGAAAGEHQHEGH